MLVINYKVSINIFLAIAKIEFEYDAWPDLFDILNSTAFHSENSYRRSSLTTIGYIGQEVNECKITDDKKTALLYSVLKNIFKENNEEVLETALEALKNFSFIITNIIQDKVILLNFINFKIFIFIERSRIHIIKVNKIIFLA